MRFRYARWLFSKTTSFWKLKELGQGKYTGTHVFMTSEEDGSGEKRRATFKGGAGQTSLRGTKAGVEECEEDLANATFSIWMHRLFPFVMQALDVDEALISLLTDILERVLQRPHNEKIRKEALDLVREIREGKYLEFYDVAEQAAPEQMEGTNG